MSEAPRRQQPNGKKETRRMVVLIVLAVIMVLLAVGCALYARWVQKPVLPSDEPVQSTGPGAVETLSIDATQPKVSGERKSQDFYTVLVVGVDTTSNLTDTIMLVSYDVTNQKANVMSIPRDTITNAGASGVDNKKINAVYTRNGRGEDGIRALKREVSELVGFMPDYHVFVEWEIVGQMVEAIGGVYYTIPWDMWYWDPNQDLKIDLKEGYQRLNGDQAMQLVRWRKNMDPQTLSTAGQKSVGDTGRLELQQDFLKSVLKQTLQIKNITRIGALAELFSQNVVSDLTVENLFWFAQQAVFGGLSVEQVEFFTMPYGYGEYPVRQSNGSYQRRSYVYAVQSRLLTRINENLNPFVEEVTVGQLDLISPNSAGGISSTTGVLADPSMAAAPVIESDAPVEEDEPIEGNDPVGGEAPITSDDPAASGGPVGSEPPAESGRPALSPPPAESGRPAVSQPPVESGRPVDGPPPESSPAPTGSGERREETAGDPPPVDSGAGQ